MSAPLPSPVTVRACAKVNLYLRIAGRRPDGYHDLVTVFQAIDLADTLEFTAEAGREVLNLRCTARDMPDIENNLIGKAYHLLCARYGERIAHPGVICRVDKQIPLGAGLGGGSADAAGTLAGLNALWNLGLTPDALAELGAELGSDVPFIGLGGTAFATGRGEQLSPLPPLPPTPLVLVVPPIHVATPDAFRWWDEAHPTEPEIASPHEIKAHWTTALMSGTWPQFLHSDFDDLVCREVPALGALRDHLRARGFYPVMTGSGSAFIAAPADADLAARLVEHYAPLAGESIRFVHTLAEPGVNVARA